MRTTYRPFISAFSLMCLALACRAAPVIMTEPHYVKPVGQHVVVNETTRNDKISATTLLLADKGEAKLPIIISTNAPAATRLVAKDLADYLSRVTGASFKIEEGDGSRGGILLGTVQEFPTPDLGKSLEIFNIYDGKEAFAIRTRPGKVLLLGNTDLGASHAAYRFLKAIGCRWFFPHNVWQVVPRIQKLTFNRDITDRPQILVRNIWFEAGAYSDYENWKRFNSQDQSWKMDNAQGGMLRAIELYPKEFAFTNHPEYYPLIKQADGSMKRAEGTYQLEYGNPEVRRMIVESTVDYFKKNPNKDMVSLEPADMPIVSQSPESRKLGSPSDVIFGLANEAARALQKAYPGQNKMIGMLAYNAIWDPPTFKLEPNINVCLTSAALGSDYSEWERFYVWLERSPNLGVYEYYSVWAWTADGLPGGYPEDMVEIKRRIHNDLLQNGLNTVSAESTDSWGNNGRGYYVATELMWNPELDMKSLLSDFYTKAFGPAAASMQQYYDRLDPHNHVIVDAHLLGLCFKDLDEAGKAAKDLPRIQARIDDVKLYMRYIYLRWVQAHPGVRGKTENGDGVMELLSRTREFGLLTFPMACQYMGSPKYPAGQKASWPPVVPYTHEEVEGYNREALEYFASDIKPLSPAQFFYSEDLVPVKWNPEQVGSAASLATVDKEEVFNADLRYIFFSSKGEPLQFSTEFIANTKGFDEIQVTDVYGGKTIAYGKLKTGVKMEQEIKVPHPGLYFLICRVEKGVRVHVPPGKPATIVSPSGRTPEGPLKQDMVFYVPKGTKNIEYRFNMEGDPGVNPHSVIDPSGSVQKTVTNKGDFVSVPVPKGMDGKLWRFRNLTLGDVWFNNAPSFLAASPDALMIPRDLAKRDGLQLLK